MNVCGETFLGGPADAGRALPGFRYSLIPCGDTACPSDPCRLRGYAAARSACPAHVTAARTRAARPGRACRGLYSLATALPSRGKGALRASRWAGGFRVSAGRRRGRLDRSLRSLHRVTPGGSRSGIKPLPAVAFYSVRLTSPPVMPRCSAGLPRVAFRPAATLSRKPPAPPAAVRWGRSKPIGYGKASGTPAASQAGFGNGFFEE